MKITVKESCIVRPSQPTPNRRLWLSNLDLIYPPVYMLAAYAYKSDGSPNFFDAKILKETLSKCVVTFYPLAGRLALDENGRREINCNGEGVAFVEAEADCPLGDYADFAANCDKLAPEVGFGRQIFSNPLILIQMTRFCCGGVLMALKGNHNVVDGGGIMHFVNAMSELARGESITLQPVFDRSFLRARNPPTPKFHHAEYDQPPFTHQTENVPESFSSLLKIPIDLVNVLKSKVNNEDVKYSTFEVLTAHLWRCSSKARNFSADQETVLLIPIDGRYRLNPDKGYSGNVIFCAKTTISTGELLSEQLVKTVVRIRKSIQRMNEDYLRSAIDYLDDKDIDTDQLVKYQGTQQLRQNHFLVNSWIRMPVFQADFGWGRPLTMLPQLESEGMAIFLPSCDGENNVPLVINLQAMHKKSFHSLLYQFGVTFMSLY